MEQVGPDGLTGYQRRAIKIKESRLRNDPDSYKKQGQKITDALGPDGLKARGQAIRKSLIDSGNMEVRSVNAALVKRSKMQSGDERKSRKRYRNRVAYLSRQQDLSALPNFELWGEAGGYELDHKYSISEGWKNNIPPEIIAMKHNLQFLEKVPNIKKGGKCDITLTELLAL